MHGGRALAALGALIALVVGAVLWLALSGPDDAADTGAGGVADAAGGAASGTTSAQKSAARRRSQAGGTAELTGAVKRRATNAPEAGCAVHLLREGFETWSAHTGADGAFRLEALPDGGPFELRVESPGCATVRLPGLALGRGEKRDVGTLWLDRAVRVPVSVRDYSDRPVSGAEVAAYTAPEYDEDFDWSKAWAQAAIEPVAVARVTTDARGAAVFEELATGSWTFVASATGRARGEARGLRLRGDEEPPEVVIRLGTGHELTGRVLDSERNPVAGALVVAGSPRDTWDIGASASRLRATADAEGRWKLAGLAAGDVALHVARPGGIPAWRATVRVPSVREYDLVLRATGAIEGTVTEKEGGKPVEGATVRATQWTSSAQTAEATSDAEGRWRIDAFPVGQVHELRAEKEGYTSVAEETGAVWGASDVRVHAGETLRRDLKVARGAVVSGRVTCGGSPVDGAKVILRVGSPTTGVSFSRTATTDAEGRWRVEAVPKGTAIGQARKEGHWQRDFPTHDWWSLFASGAAPSAFRAEVPESGEAKLDLVLEKGATVRGRVEGSDGPVADARVAARGATSRSAADGTFVLEGVEPGPQVPFEASLKGHVAAGRTTWEVPSAGEVPEVVLRLEPAPVVRGRVTSADGSPLVDARVHVSPAQAPGAEAIDMDADRYAIAAAEAFPVLADGTYEARVGWAEGAFYVRAEDPTRGVGASVVVPLVAGCREYLTDVTLDAASSVRGRVVSGGTGVAGADVSASEYRPPQGGLTIGGGSDPSVVHAVTGPDGSFEVRGLAAGAWDLSAKAPGFVRGQAPAVRVPGAGEVRIELVASLSISGRVVLGDGSPVAGVVVQATAESSHDFSIGPVFDDEEGEGSGRATTGPDGSFAVKGLAPGGYLLRVSPAWMSGANVRPATAGPFAAGTEGVRIVAQAGGSISGRVVDADGAAVEGSWITVTRGDGPADVDAETGDHFAGDPFRAAVTRPDGTFELAGLARGAFTVLVQSPGGAHQPLSKPGVAVGTKDLVLRVAAGLTIEGVVSGADGKPMQGVFVRAERIRDEDEEPSDGRWVSFGTEQSETDAGGRFRIGGLAPGRYRLSSPAWANDERPVVLRGGEDVAAGTGDLRLTAGPGAKITGVAVDETGAPVGGATVEPRTSEDWYPDVTADAQGRFSVAGLPEGASFTLTVSAPGRASAVVRKVAAGTEGLRVVLPKGLVVTGRVLDAAGRPAARLELSLHPERAPVPDDAGDEDEDEEFPTSVSAQTDDAGNFRAEGLGEGDWTVTAYVRTGESSFRGVVVGTVRAGAEGVELKLPK